MGQVPGPADSSAAESAIHVTHVLGLEGVRHNANGELRVQNGVMEFQQSGSPAVQVSATSIQNILLGEEDTQVGGVPMMVGKTAAPFGGGRVVSLFAHKKYDSLTVEYLDNNKGLHGALFRVTKGQGQTFKKTLVSNGAHVATLEEDHTAKQTTPEVKNENK